MLVSSDDCDTDFAPHARLPSRNSSSVYDNSSETRYKHPQQLELAAVCGGTQPQA
jgi:hypothetical protein